MCLKNGTTIFISLLSTTSSPDVSIAQQKGRLPSEPKVNGLNPPLTKLTLKAGESLFPVVEIRRCGYAKRKDLDTD